jgi:hypothetical protein
MQLSCRETFVQAILEDLHELCQPLTALQCRLEVARMPGEPRMLLETVEDSLMQTRRMFAAVAVMRERLLSEEAREWAED